MRKRIPLLAAAALAIILAACSTPSDTPPGAENPTRPEGVITGVITTSTGEALSNAPVTLQEYTLEAANTLQVQSSSFTDEHGQFGLNITTPGTYALQATGENEGVFEIITVTSTDGKLVAQDLELTSAEYGIVELTVHAPDSTPAADSLVYLAGTNHIGMTNAAGRTTLTRVPAGNYTAVASGEGYGRSEGLNVTVKSAETTTGGPLELKNLSPVIHSVTPVVVSLTDYGRLLVTIQGENFGHQRDLGQVLEPDWDDYQVMFDSGQQDGRILSWSDNEILLETYSLLDLELQFDDPAAPDLWNRFQVVTNAGTSNLSNRVEALSAYFHYGQEFFVNDPAEPLELSFTLHSSSAEVITEATVTHVASSGDLTYGTISAVDTFEDDDFIFGDGITVVRHSAHMNVTHVPAAAEDGDSFTITSTVNDVITGNYECTLVDATEWSDTPWYWYCY